MRIVQISDTHLFADNNENLLGVKTFDSLKAVLAMLTNESQQPDMIVLSGDLSQDKTTESYQTLVSLFRPFDIPIYSLPGNHDSTEVMSQVLDKTNISMGKNLISNNWNIIFLNSQIEDRVEGSLASEELQFLEDSLLEYNNHHSIVIFHHHPAPVGVDWLDRIGLQNADEFWEIANKHKNLKYVFFGHVHQEFHGTKDGIKYFSTPSTCIQFKGNCQGFTLENIPQGFRWLELKENGEIETGVKRLDKYVGVFDPTATGY